MPLLAVATAKPKKQRSRKRRSQQNYLNPLNLLNLPIHSATNVAVDYQVAPLFERSLAFIIDFVAVQFVAQLLAYTVGLALVRMIGDDYFLNLFVQVFMPLLILLAYFALSEYLFEGRTLGKRVLGLRTIRIDGAPPTFETFGLRSAMLILDFVLSVGALGLLAAGSSPLRQRIGDRIAQTVVIRGRTPSLYRLDDILNIKTVDDHQVVYTDAVKLDVDQALLLKELIVRRERHRTDELRDLLDVTARRVSSLLGLDTTPQRRLEFLRQVLRDYIVLTR